METIFEKMRNIGLIPVVKIDNADDAVPLAKALIAGGLPAAEVTYRTDAAEETIRRITKECPDMLVGAGTVINVELAKSAIAAGAKFIVSPGFNPSVVDYCLEHNVPMIPGVSSASQIEEALNRNMTVLKLFPAEVVGGVAMLDALAGPFGQCLFMPTGGVNTDNLGEYAKRKNVLAIGGTWMVKSDLINGKQWDKITAICKEALVTLQGFSLGHIGLNATDETNAAEIANDFLPFGYPVLDGAASIFMGTTFEIMKKNGRGTHGHICFLCNNVDRSLAYLAQYGFKPIMETAQYMGDKGNSPLKFVYLDKQINGFAVHLKKN
jgi:2-dehydro-3-deoxyphosphogluconate aldolase/(4S)-4-hydroxy-2-oxoglutarate aldolase